MDNSKDFYYQDIFNYSSFLKDDFLTDCEIRIHSKEKAPEFTSIKAHRLVLANSSVFFHALFTSGMEESQTGVVDVYDDIHSLLTKIIDWMYSGIINFTLNDLIPLLNLSHKYGIDQLETILKDDLSKHVNAANVLKFAQICYDDELQNALDILIPFLSLHFSEIKIQDFSNTLDVATFAKVIKETDLSTEEKIIKITDFLQNWEPSAEEKMQLFYAFSPSESQLKPLAKIHNVKWLP